MKPLLLFMTFLFQQTVDGQKPVTILFENDSKDVYHLSLIIYTPDGKVQTRVSNLDPKQIKKYVFYPGTKIYIVEPKQEAIAMKGNDIRAAGVGPTYVLSENNDKVMVKLSTLSQIKNAAKRREEEQ